MENSRTDPSRPRVQSRFLTVWLPATRPKTLLAAWAPVIIGTALAFRDGVMFWPAALCALLSATCIQVGTNLYNDYADFRKGADTADRVGPERATAAGLVTPDEMRRAAGIVFAMAVLTGAYLMIRGGIPIAVIGILSIGAGYLYSGTRFALAYTGLADLFVLVFFGPVAVGGTYFVQALGVSPEVVIAGVAPGLLAVAILLVNNLRDVDQDRQADKRTLVVRFGRRFGIAAYVACVVLAAAIPLVLRARFSGTLAATLAALVLVLAVPLVLRLRTLTRAGMQNGAALNGTLAATARLLLFYSVVFAIGWNVGS